MISCAKALSAAFQPISALLINERDLPGDARRERQARATSPTATPIPAIRSPTAVALETLRIYEETDIVGHVQPVGPRLHRRPARSSPTIPWSAMSDGVGLIARLELVADKATRRPFPPRPRSAHRDGPVRAQARAVVRVIGNRIALSPPLIITEAEVDELLKRLGHTLDDIEAALRKQAAYSAVRSNRIFLMRPVETSRAAILPPLSRTRWASWVGADPGRRRVISTVSASTPSTFHACPAGDQRAADVDDSAVAALAHRPGRARIGRVIGADDAGRHRLALAELREGERAARAEIDLQLVLVAASARTQASRASAPQPAAVARRPARRACRSA